MTRALIIGAGIGGAVTAMGLDKIGVEPVVYESYPAGADDVGAWLSLMINGLDGLRAIDAHQPVLDNSFPASGVEFFTGGGRQLGAAPLAGAGSLQPRMIKRAGLYRVLHDEASRRGIRIEHGKRLHEAVIMPDGRVRARFADGSEADGDLLIGADGVRSTTRTLIDRNAPKPRYLGTNTVCGYTTDSPVTTPPGMLRMIYGRRVFFGCTTAPDGETWWFASIPNRTELSRAELAAITSEQWRRRMIDLVAPDGGPVAGIVEATVGEIVGSSNHDLPTVPRWRSGPMIILGDAAHVASPSAGQGASMAIEDGVVLAKCLRDLPDTGQAFRTYERLRRERVERLVATSAKMRKRAVPGPVGRVIRDALLPRLLAKGPRNTQDWLTGHHIDWDTPATQLPTRESGR